MDKENLNSNCPICYNKYSDSIFICTFEVCLHDICFDCFLTLKTHSDKCPICGLFYKRIFKKDFGKCNEIIEIYELSEFDLSQIKSNKEEVLGKF